MKEYKINKNNFISDEAYNKFMFFFNNLDDKKKEGFLRFINSSVDFHPDLSMSEERELQSKQLMISNIKQSIGLIKDTSFKNYNSIIKTSFSSSSLYSTQAEFDNALEKEFFHQARDFSYDIEKFQTSTLGFNSDDYISKQKENLKDKFNKFLNKSSINIVEQDISFNSDKNIPELIDGNKISISGTEIYSFWKKLVQEDYKYISYILENKNRFASIAFDILNIEADIEDFKSDEKLYKGLKKLIDNYVISDILNLNYGPHSVSIQHEDQDRIENFISDLEYFVDFVDNHLNPLLKEFELNNKKEKKNHNNI
jgi:hypothetical protein